MEKKQYIIPVIREILSDNIALGTTSDPADESPQLSKESNGVSFDDEENE